MPIPEKQYTRLEALLERWNLSRDDVFYAVENGLLHCCIWLQPRYMECGRHENGCFLAKQQQRRNGLVGVRPEDCHAIFHDDEVMAHSFIPIETPGEMLRITHEPPQPYICLRLQHLLVMREEQQRFEQTYHIRFRNKHRNRHKHYQKGEHHKPSFKAHNNYKEVINNGTTYHLGQVQADIVKQLHDASKGADPWVHGKTLLANSCSQAMRFQDIFKNKSGWRDLIESDGRGHYRLNLKAKKFHQPPAYSAPERKQAHAY
ncbi:MAG: hypothetical protein MK052_07275 [Alphaproteobacteria bacterium]|nr:hypothetical protein [Alphaproteobacteria bacterium]